MTARSLASHPAALGADAVPPATLAAQIDPAKWQAVQKLTLSGFSSPLTTSMGRLFDAVAALCGLRLDVSYEGQAAAELEALCDPGETGVCPLPLRTGAHLVLDARPTIRSVLRDLDHGVPPDRVAGRFHNAISTAIIVGCIHVAVKRGVHQVVLAGGSFQNRRLLAGVSAGLRRAGVQVLIPEQLPPNDGGISFGQAAIAAARTQAVAAIAAARTGHPHPAGGPS